MNKDYSVTFKPSEDDRGADARVPLDPVDEPHE